MSILRCLVCSIGLLMCFGHSVFAIPTECGKLADTERSMQRSLYEYAQVADIVYTGLSQWQVNRKKGEIHNCVEKKTSQRIGIPGREISELSNRTHEYLRSLAEFIGGYKDVEPHEGNDGRIHLTCKNRRTKRVRLSLGWGIVVLGNTLSINLDINVVVPRGIFNEERLAFVELSRTGHEQEQLIAFKGTDFTEIDEIATSVNDLLKPTGSCVFPVAERFVGGIVKRLIDSDNGFRLENEWLPVRNIVVVGHSLGGAAAQHIAATVGGDSQILGEYYDAFNTYSFNAVGLDKDSIGRGDLSNHYSYYIEGEFASTGAEIFVDRIQPGHVIHYVPPENSERWPKIGWRPQEAFRRHKLDTVQEAICECINGRGSVVSRDGR